jgi:hypothetical protein
MIPLEHRRTCFDDIDKLMGEVMTMLVALNDPQTTDEQKQEITRAQTKLLDFEREVIGDLKGKMGV